METVKGPDSSQEYLLTKLIDQYQAVLLQLCFMYLHDRAMAEDAVQETFLKAYRSMTAFRGECSEKTWLTRIAINTCRDMKRSAWFRHMDRRVTTPPNASLRIMPVVQPCKTLPIARQHQEYHSYNMFLLFPTGHREHRSI